MSKKIKLTNGQIKELKGFEDVVDLVFEGNPELQAMDSRRSNDSYDLYTFLETENTRLALLHDFFANRVKIHEENPQLMELIEEQRNYMLKLEKEILTHLSGPQAPFQRRVSVIFNQAFGLKPEE